MNSRFIDLVWASWRVIAFLILIGSYAAADDQFPRFANDSFWYQHVPLTVELHPKNLELQEEFRRLVKSRYGVIGLNINSYSAPLYVVDEKSPRYDITFVDCLKNGGRSASVAPHFSSVPVPTNARPAGGSDSEISIFDPTSDTLWEFWKMGKTATGWAACWGGRMNDVSNSPGIWQRPFGASATGLPFSGGQIRIAELTAGRIEHVIGIAVPVAAKGSVSWPANRSDGRDTGFARELLVEGMRLRLDPRVQVEELNLHPVAATIARAAQIYGFVVWDLAGSVSLRLEPPFSLDLDKDQNPYKDLFKETPAHEIMRNFPVEHIQFLPLDYGRSVN